MYRNGLNLQEYELFKYFNLDILGFILEMYKK